MEPRHGAVCSAALMAALLLFPTAGGPARAEDQAPAPAVTPADDAYHYAAWADGSYDGLYTEWWYFNFHDPFTAVRAIFSYFVTDPDDIYGNAQAQMVAVAYTPDGIVTAVDPYVISDFSASDQQADVHIGANAAQLAPNGTYRVTGASLDGRLVWDLTYARRSTPWFAADRMTVGDLSWEQMSWLVQMPRASVTGTLTVDGRLYNVYAPGYHDHNWGEWIPTDALWNWAQFSNPRLSIELGDFIGKPLGLLALDLDGARTVFTHDQYNFVNTVWAWDSVNRLYYPKESHLTADNGALRVDIRLRAWQTVPLRGDLPWPLRDLIIYEQTARYEGRVWKWKPPADPTTGEGEWAVTALIGGMGFKEWTWRRF